MQAASVRTCAGHTGTPASAPDARTDDGRLSDQRQHCVHPRPLRRHAAGPPGARAHRGPARGEAPGSVCAGGRHPHGVRPGRRQPQRLLRKKRRRHGVNLQFITDPGGRILWISQVLPGGTHDLPAARRHRVIATCIRLGLPVLADLAVSVSAEPSPPRNGAASPRTHRPAEIVEQGPCPAPVSRRVRHGPP